MMEKTTSTRSGFMTPRYSKPRVMCTPEIEIPHPIKLAKKIVFKKGIAAELETDAADAASFRRGSGRKSASPPAANQPSQPALRNGTGNFLEDFVIKPLPNLEPVGLMLIKYLKGGTLDDILFKAKEKKMRIPNRILWLVFFCLVKGVITMRFPPTRYHENHAKFGGSTGMIWNERMPSTGEIPDGFDNVHYDLDPSNVFMRQVGDGGSGDKHRVFPIAKVADFGLLTLYKYRGTRFTRASNMWEERLLGKGCTLSLSSSHRSGTG
ncbi:hypothetical protein QBC38DRAFT_448279 [Podospora fimiseda]|uniref:Protein kinase domain-containing protein n=1 Tax=Podospora fimiseda TaxID=252190 RepID=A0AAN6YNL0_9PEZI|nr:hypothetical protein QBC38DRAFT_448279 [Podospora fimiseda]